LSCLLCFLLESDPFSAAVLWFFLNFCWPASHIWDALVAAAAAAASGDFNALTMEI
jgi:hypothetical protein